jgi:predicted HNH restriction endonuclease
LKKEVDKCIMVCANCHIEIHEELKKKENVL